MKSRNSILKQLLINILLPVLATLGVVFILSFQFSKAQLERELKTQKKNIVAETRNLIAYFDFSMRAHEQAYIAKMKQVAFQLRTEIGTTNQLDTLNLYRISNKIGLDTSTQHIYLINKKLKIINTTFKPDLGLDFAKMNASFDVFFGEIFKANKFKEDRFGLEVNTGKIKKYAFLPTQNKNAIIELGFYSKEADAYRSLLLRKIESLSTRYKGIEKVQLYLGVKGQPDINMKGMRLKKAYLACLDQKTNQSVIYSHKRTELFFLPVLEAKLYAGYILEIDQNDSQEKLVLKDLLMRFLTFSIITSIFLVLLVFWRAQKITLPIKQLSEKTKAINSTNLNQQISISGSKELAVLSNNFNEMIDKLRVSYEGLEEKVNERTAQLVHQKALVDHQNKEMLESIQYARFIQQALLPSETFCQNYFPQSFIYYAPKDIIAGDFYWFEQIENISWFAVADCTGHGVPGAMMSVLCINALNQALAEAPQTTTGLLLDLVREKVVQTLSKESRSVKDGMDISLASFHHDTKELQWTGANNPLWIIRNGELLIFNADKQPVGQFDHVKPFTTNHVFLQKNDLLILFSDGYADQFGGPKNKKFKYSTLKELLLSISEYPTIDQKNELQIRFESWKKDEEQTDDVCLMLVRVD